MQIGKANIKADRKETSSQVSGLNSLGCFYKKYLAKPLWAGSLGFVSFFLFAILMDFLVNLFNTRKNISIDTLTILISSTVFIFSFTLKLLEILKRK